MRIRTYSELRRLKTFRERYEYLRLVGKVGAVTFGHDRYINQMFYKSREWLACRDDVIIRDEGCDLGVSDREIFDKIIVHHMNPVSLEDLEDMVDEVLDPEFLICTTTITHSAIHYGDESLLVQLPVIRKPGDTSPWL